MPTRDVAAMNASLDNDYGTTAGPNAPASHDLALFDGDPMLDGVELSGNGYARVSVAPADWLASDAGAKATAAPVQFADATGEWSEASHFGLFYGGTETLGDCAPLTEALEVTAAGPGPQVVPVVFNDDAVDAPE